MPYQLLTPPAAEPVDVDDVKLNSRIEGDDDDALIAELITSARMHVENYTVRSLINQTWKLVLDAFPGCSSTGQMLIQRPFSLPDNALLLEKTPVQSISSIGYTDMGSNPQTFDPTQYKVDSSGDICRITPIFGQIWPITLPQIGSVNVTFVAGYGPDGTSVPSPILRAIKMLAGHFYNNREATSAANLKEIPIGICAMLDPYQLQLN